MKRILGVTWAVVVVSLLGACNSSSTADSNEVSNAASKAAPKADVAKPVIPKVTLPAGTPIKVVLKDSVGTDTSSAGSEFTGTLAEPVVMDGRTVLEKGSPVLGRIVDVKRAGRVKGRASLSLVLTSVVRDGKSVPVETKTYVGVAKSTNKRDAAVIAGAAGVGAAIGAIAGGGKGAATGAAVGGGGGTGAVLATRGDDLHYPSETRLNFVLSKSAVI